MQRRGIVLNLPDLDRADSTQPGWPELMQELGLNVLGLHADLRSLAAFMQSPAGERLRAELGRRRIDLEFELHLLGTFLTPELFQAHPEFFAMDVLGQRDEGGNPSVMEPGLLDRAREWAAEAARLLAPTTGRHHLWAMDNRAWCNCRLCEHLSPSEQNLTLMNAMLEGVRGVDPRAKLAYAAYIETMEPPDPHVVRPHEGLFLEFAPYRRNFTRPLDEPTCRANVRTLESLRSLLKVFGPGDAKVLEYWIDVSYFSNYRRPSKPVQPAAELLQRDMASYAAAGIASVTTFACRMDAAYLAQHGGAAVARYAAAARGA